VNAAVVLLLDPGLGGAVEQLESEHRLAFEHGHEAALDLSPEDFLFAVLLGRLGEGREVLDGEALEPFLRLGSEHGRAVVAEEPARQASLLEALAQAVDEALSVFGEVPLRVAADTGAVVEQPEQHRVLPLSTLRQHLALGLVEIAVPESVHVRDLE
jgi:hypothetical protein